MKRCSSCTALKPLSEFQRCKQNKDGYRGRCKNCIAVVDGEARKQSRKDPAFRAKWICEDSKRDKKKGRQNDLSVDFVEGLIASGCAYCGDTHLQMTLDRIDNALGHLRTNVVPSCIRCNLLRSDMPYEAWYFLLPAVRAARERGLFGDWIGRR